MMEQLTEFERQYTEIDHAVTDIEDALNCQQITHGKARDDLAQLEAKLDKLQFNGVDSIDTFELQTGKEQARALRKVLTRRAEQMHTRMDAIFQEILAAMSKK